MGSKPRLVILVLMGALGTPLPARADPVRAVSGSIRWQADGATVFLVGDGFEFDGGLRSGLVLPVATGGGCLGASIFGSDTPCHPGDIVDQSAHTTGEVGIGLGQTFVVFDGKNYPDTSLRLSFAATATPAPFPNVSGNEVFLTAPFVFTGLVRGFSNGSEVFDVSLSGAGTTGRTFVLEDDGYHYRLDSLGGSTGYVLGGQAPAPTPEPASLLLLGTGTAALFVRYRRSQS